MKKSHLILSLCLPLVLVSCTPRQKTGSLYNSIDDLGEFDTTKDVSITFYHTMGQDSQKILNNYIEIFNEQYPNIIVDHRSLGGYNDVRDQLQKELAVSAQTNITYCYPDHVASYLKSNKVLNLDIMIEDTKYGYGFSEADKNNFVSSYYNEGKAFGDGHMYCLPFSKSTEVLYYNKTFFEANNLKVPTTWNEMEEVCKKIKTLKPKDTPLGYDSTANLFITLAEQTGAGYTSVDTNNSYKSNFIFNNATNKANANMIRDWYQKGYIETSNTYGQYTSGLFTQLDETKPRCYMCIGSSAGASYQRPENEAFEVGITSIPQMDKNNSKVISQGPSVCIFQDSDPQKVIASWLFLKFFTTNVEFQAELSMTTGYVPVVNSVFENEIYREFLNEADGYNHLQAYSCTVCTNQKNSYFTSPAFNGSADARVNVETLLYNCMIAKQSEYNVDDLFEKAVQACEYAII